jgi:hypothetical protein
MSPLAAMDTEKLIAASLDAIGHLRDAQVDLTRHQQRTKTMLVGIQTSLDTFRENQPDELSDPTASSPPSDSE